MGNRLEGKVAIVTGSNRGIGWATAELFAKEGAKVVISGRTEEVGRERVETIKAAGGEAIFVRCDVCIPEDIENLVNKAVEAFGTVDILVNNVGGGDYSSLESSVEDWDWLVNLNGRSTFLGMKYVAPIMKEKGSGSIINITSSSVHRGDFGTMIYEFAKGGVVNMTKCAAVEMAPYNVRVNCVSPGVIKTDVHNGYPQEDIDAMLAAIPMGRMGEPIEIAYPCLFLASEESTYCSGRVLEAQGAGYL